MTETPAVPVHLRHFSDGYPLCWDQDREGSFIGAYDEGRVTCPDCLKALADD
jgi:hypothetical protein